MGPVLIVDASAHMRRRCISLVRRLGYETVEAGDCSQAVEAYERARPQAVFMDATTPRTNGVEALRQIMALDPDANVAVVARFDQRDPIYQAIKAGARAFVMKPYRPENVKSVLQKLESACRTA